MQHALKHAGLACFSVFLLVKTHQILLISGVCGAGFLCGFSGRRMSGGDDPPPAAASAPLRTKASRTTTREPADGNAAAAAKTSKPKTSKLRSSDTLETLLALDDASLYSRLALWMMDAGKEDIEGFWQAYRQRKNRSNDINDLVFINWTRLDPQAAIAAAKGTADEHYAWWAWACHDPKGSLTAAIAENKDRVNNVAWGIGEFQADWLMKHFDEIPESGRSNALRGLTKWDDTDKPLEVLEFLKKHDGGFNQGIFATLTRKDPWAAYDWIRNNESTIDRYYGSSDSAMQQLVKTMGETQPDALERLIAQTPSGNAKRQMESVLFDNLLKTDPEAALAQAESTKAPRIAAERLAAVGLAVVRSDPDKAMELTKKLFDAYPDALNATVWVRYPNGATGSGSSIRQVEDLVDGLMESRPDKLLEMLPAKTGDNRSGGRAFSELAGKWADRDLAGFTNWVNTRTDPEVRDRAAGIVVDQLAQQHQYEEAVEWAMSSEKTKGSLFNVFYQWNRTNPAEAGAWLESADIPADKKEEYSKMLKEIESHEE